MCHTTDKAIAFMLICIFSVKASESNYTEKIFNAFGGEPLNFSEVALKVLDGKTYKIDSQRCEGPGCENKCYAYSKNVTVGIQKVDFNDECPRLLFYLTQECIKSVDINVTTSDASSKSSSAEVWGYGFLAVTIINLGSCSGIILFPLMKKEFYSSVMVFLIGLAVGTLAASALFVLIPEAFEITHSMENYLWRACCIMGGIYFFFVIERIIQMIAQRVTKSKGVSFGHSHTAAHGGGIHSISLNSESTTDMISYGNNNDDSKISDSRATLNHQDSFASTSPLTEKKPVATVAWMILVGDGLHNFIDGISIGAAFSDNLLLGLTVSVAVMCEEVPHELGDFAILLNAGLGKKKALLFNFISSCTCYAGLILGISLSEIGHTTPWILGIAGGMFLYIALADMVPEMNSAAEEMNISPGKLFFLQNAGLLVGLGIIFLIGYFGKQIDFTS